MKGLPQAHRTATHGRAAANLSSATLRSTSSLYFSRDDDECGCLVRYYTRLGHMLVFHSSGSITVATATPPPPPPMPNINCTKSTECKRFQSSAFTSDFKYSTSCMHQTPTVQNLPDVNASNALPSLVPSQIQLRGILVNAHALLCTLSDKKK